MGRPVGIPKTGGRKAGTPNKASASAKAAIEQVFLGLGDATALEQWARSDPDNMKAFYVSIWPKILPMQVNGSGEQGEHLVSTTIKLVGVRADGG